MRHPGWILVVFGLCPALFRYFKVTPSELYVKAEEIR